MVAEVTRQVERTSAPSSLSYEMEQAGVAPRLTRVILVVVMACIGVVAVIKVIETRLPVVQTALCLVYLIAVVALQLRYFARQDGTPEPRRPSVIVALVAQGLLAFLPLIQFGRAWVGMPGLFAGSLLLALPQVLAWSAFPLIVVGIGAVQYQLSGSIDDVVYTAISTVLTGLVVYGLCRLSSLVGTLSRARAEIARLAVEAERDRVARDLHDLIGYQLSAITLKTELAQRLVDVRPERARAELDEALAVSRNALADVRSVARGTMSLSLRSEIRSTRMTIAAAGIDVQLTENGDPEAVSEAVRSALAVVLREAATNVLRHSNASTCAIGVDYGPGPVTLTVDNDGAESTTADRDPSRPGGLRNLAHRLESVGGTFDAGPHGDGTYRLRATID